MKKWNDEKEQLIQKTAIKEYSAILNQQLSRIFYENQRIHIGSELGKLSSRNNPILFEALSTAEKNILSLCYFFLKVEQEVQTNSSNPILIVFDDPIASTDFDNKVGLYSLFRNAIEKLLEINSDIRFIILTHDEDVYYNFYKVFDDIHIYKNNKPMTFELTAGGLDKRDNEFNFYRKLLNDTYRYALELAPELDMYIGNAMRRVLEAFATFNYALGPSELSTNDEVLGLGTNELEREFFKGYMYRLILNTDSHASDRVQNSSPIFKEMFSQTEKIRTAQLLIAFLYRLNPLHVKRMIDVRRYKLKYKELEDAELKCRSLESFEADIQAIKAEIETTSAELTDERLVLDKRLEELETKKLGSYESQIRKHQQTIEGIAKNTNYIIEKREELMKPHIDHIRVKKDERKNMIDNLKLKPRYERGINLEISIEEWLKGIIQS